MSIRHTAIIIALNAKDTARFITREDNEIDVQILENAGQQIKTRKINLPKPNDIMVITVGLTEDEVQKLMSEDDEFETHFLEILTQQAENTKKDIVRFERQKMEGHVPSRRERRALNTT